ncbi:Uma2 family endonuclease [Desulfobulbus sp. N2]|nr:Uma2 family endonuclease [Desulfobulbus sp. N2]MCW5210232.1 Uma2 family endonuclease [Desulfobulbus sp. N3]WLE95484.1 MAG: Uma2 family endonuclease [Candidatus Electrothrix communis]
MDWAAVINNPFLQNLPFKIELNKWGQVLMTPASNSHGRHQFNVGDRIKTGKKGHGQVIMECSIQTSQGVKVADVAWASEEFIKENGFVTPYSMAPEICVEIISPSNSKGEIEEKIELYLAKGAHEVWIVNDKGKTRYYKYKGEIPKSSEVSTD